MALALTRALARPQWPSAIPAAMRWVPHRMAFLERMEVLTDLHFLVQSLRMTNHVCIVVNELLSYVFTLIGQPLHAVSVQSVLDVNLFFHVRHPFNVMTSKKAIIAAG